VANILIGLTLYQTDFSTLLTE